MELVNARRSRTVLTAGNEGDIIAAVKRESFISRNFGSELIFFQPRVIEIPCDSHLHHHNLNPFCV
jgi:hypothetical protein